VVADRLRNDADRAFALSAVTALVLMLVAGMLWWQLRRRELQVASLEHERRLAQLGEMSAVLAHEMRNPLASLKGNAQLLLEQLPSESREAKKAERVVSEATRLEALSRTLLDFVRSGSVERRPVDVVSLLRHAIDEVGPDRVELTTQGDVGRPVKLDSLRMNQVLVNLLENALDVSSDNQPVEVALEVRGQTLRVEVRDSGPGLEPGDEAKIFEAFHTKKTHGTGLGLAIARRIVQMHGGTLTARNHPEAGAVFVVELPGASGHWRANAVRQAQALRTLSDRSSRAQVLPNLQISYCELCSCDPSAAPPRTDGFRWT
jgi:two-component system sensor histidine kinase HydH